jgi:tRNA-dihydrouridine synthase A
MTINQLSIAPMLDCTDRHFRFLMRLISRKVLLYTEMLTTKEVLENKSGTLLAINPIEHPVAIQLGGSSPKLLAMCAKMASDAGFDEINLNVGCPSARVQSGKIGACLMLEPEVVAECIAAMRQVTNILVSVKCRLGVDDSDTYDCLHHFVKTVASAGCSKFIIHARKAWLKGLSHKQNREIPPLDYPRAYQLKADFPELNIILNGGITNPCHLSYHIAQVDGIMIGRAAYHNPYLFSEVDRKLYDFDYFKEEKEVVLQYKEYIRNELALGTRLNHMTRHLLGLFHHKPGASYWRQHLSCNSTKKDAGISIIDQALAAMGQVSR